VKLDGPDTYSGELLVFNSRISAAVPDPKNMLAPSRWNGSCVRLVNSEISWISQRCTYGIDRHRASIEGCRFLNSGIAICGGEVLARDCLFQDLDCGIADYGSMDATVNVTCAATPGAVMNVPGFTGKDGRTPTDYSRRPILLTTRRYVATATPDQPDVLESFAYRVTVAAPGKATVEQALAKEAAKPLVIVLQAAGSR
jgi:hypothetical protein